MEYDDFLKGKIAKATDSGFIIDAADINPILKPHQRDIVRWAVQGGQRAIFAAFGLGKSIMQLETIRLTIARSGGRGLIVCPLGVRQEFVHDARMLGLDIRFIRRDKEVTEEGGLWLTNYESIRDGRLSPELFSAVSLDEASVLRSFGSKTYQTFLTLFGDVPYRFVATATPSPNRYKELIHYAGFLGVMDTGQALTRFFKRDSTKANHLTLFPHKEREFWLWLNTWAIFIQRPSDLGYDDTGYDLPPLDVHWHEVMADDETKVGRDGQAALFRGGSSSLIDTARDHRDSMPARIAKAAELVAESPDDHFILWHDLEAERHAIQKSVPEAVSVWGSEDLDEREQRIIGFSDGDYRILSTKPIIAGSGCNFQKHCHRAVFVGVGFKFNDFIQAVHRIYRFLQTDQVRIDIIYASSETAVVDSLRAKWARHKELTSKMEDIIKEYGLSREAIDAALQRSLGVERVEASGDGWRAVNNDNVIETRRMDENSVDEIITSIPFSNHYEYTPSYNDFGHTDNNDHFWAQMDYLTPQLLRILKPGRLYCCHVKDRILFGSVTGAGAPTVDPFHAQAIAHGMKHGFDFMGMITVVTDVVRENNQTYRLGFSENSKDGSKMGVGCPEYVLLFRKPQTDRTKGYADVPVKHPKDRYSLARWQVDAHAFWRSSGERHLTPEEISALDPATAGRLFTEQTLREVYDYESHVQIGDKMMGRGTLPSTFMALNPGSWAPDVWHDVNRMLTLNTSQSQRAQELHVCPLQFDIVDRLIERYSMPGELVFDPFGGIMTVPYRALLKDRRGAGIELNQGYWADGVKYLQSAEREKDMPTLFDLDAS
jgi:DNA modification methylase